MGNLQMCSAGDSMKAVSTEERWQASSYWRMLQKTLSAVRCLALRDHSG